MVRVSVIIPAYNQSHYLGQAIRSVLDQTYQDFEVVIVDDGSTDNTPRVTRRFGDSRIRYLYQTNQGLPAARNTGIRHSVGSFISFLDSDDLFLPSKLAFLTEFMDSHPEVGFVAGRAFLIHESGAVVGTVDGRMPEDLTHLLLGNPLHVGAVLLRRDWCERVGGFDEQLRACEDWDMWLRMAIAGCNMSSVDQLVSCYRVHGLQMTREADRMRKAMLATLDKTFSSPDLPASWQALRENAYAHALAKAAAREYRAGMLAEARLDLAEAVARDSELLENDGEALASFFLGWAFDTATASPAEYIETVYGSLPESLRSLSKQKRRLVSDVHAKLAFDRWADGNVASAGHAAWRAIRHEPNWLTNRGLLSILCRSIAGKILGRHSHCGRDPYLVKAVYPGDLRPEGGQ